MKLKVKTLGLDAGGKTVVIINSGDAVELGVRPLERIVLSRGRKKLTAIVNVSENFVKPGEVIVYDEVKKLLGIPEEIRVVALLPIGYPDASPGPKPRKSMEEITVYDIWG